MTIDLILYDMIGGAVIHINQNQVTALDVQIRHLVWKHVKMHGYE